MFKFLPKFSAATCSSQSTRVACSVYKQVKLVVPGLAGWVTPLGIFAGWMVWPALTPDFKRTVGLSWGVEGLKSDARYEEADSEEGVPTLK